MATRRDLLRAAYAAFNARDIDGALAAMHTDVRWPNGMEGGYVDGHEAVRAYWTRQWEQIDPHVEPVGFADEGPGRVRVAVRQVVRSRAGEVLVDTVVQHVYTFDGDLIRTMEIEEGARTFPSG
jgi:ketosteroid isomerase-like protein